MMKKILSLLLLPSTLCWFILPPDLAHAISYADPTPYKSVTTYYGDLFTVKDGVQIKHIKLGGETIADTYSGKTVYYINNHLGSPIMVIDHKTGEVLETIDYDPYGQIVKRTPGPGSQAPATKAFNGQVPDKESGLVYFKARYYDPIIGRFITPDTLVPNPQSGEGFNRYSYAYNNPITYADPSGRFAFIAALAKVVGAIVTLAKDYPIIMSAIAASGSSMINSLSNGASFGQAYLNSAIAGAQGAAIGGLGVLGGGPLAYAGAGAIIGGSGSVLNGGSFGEGAGGGAIGGLLAFHGGSLMAQDFFGAGLAGSMVTSAGISAIENSAMAQRYDSRMLIYFGPLSVEVSKGMKPRFSISSFTNLFFLGEAILDHQAKFSLRHTLSSGTPVFLGGGGVRRGGRAKGNVIYVQPGYGEGTHTRMIGGRKDPLTQNVLGHERIHANMQGRYAGSGGPLAQTLSDLMFVSGDFDANNKYEGPSLGLWPEQQALSFETYGAP